MSPLVYRIVSLLQGLLASVPVGTNRGLLQLMLVLLSGRLLSSRGALFPALSDLGLDPAQVRRAEAALCYGRYRLEDLTASWQRIVLSEGHFVAHCYEGYRPLACDLTGFFRPQLQGAIGKHYHSPSGKALPALCVGMVAAVGSVGKMRLALPRALLTGQAGDTREKDLKRRTLCQAACGLQATEVLLVDAEFEISELLQAKVARFVRRADSNFTARRNALPTYQGKGRRPEYGELVRPLARTYRDTLLPATPPDATTRWKVGKRWVKAGVWENLVASEAKPGEPSFRCVAIWDPRYKHPLLLVTNLTISVFALWQLYKDRWSIEQLPLAAKQMLGAERSFVFGQDSRQRWPVLALLAGNLLSYVAATSAPVATGFWDRCARPTCGRIRRVLSQLHFCDLPTFSPRFRKKNSPTDHLTKGVKGHRRTIKMNLANDDAHNS